MPRRTRLPRLEHLLDVNVFVALLAEDHVHHQLVTGWFNTTPKLRWAVCPFTEAGFLRNATAARPGRISMNEATTVLAKIMEHPGFRYLPIAIGWATLSAPFFRRLYGTKQVTDAYLLGLAVHEDLILVTLDKGIVHLAGEEHRKHVLLLAD